MTAHLHSTFVDGCYRCELSKDEVPTPAEQVADMLAGKDILSGDMAYEGKGYYRLTVMLHDPTEATPSGSTRGPDE